MRACIVGHGPSLLKYTKGSEIDGHDKVIRLKASRNLLCRPDIFGTKTDIVCGSFVVGTGLVADWSDEYWLFIDTRTENKQDHDITSMIRAFYPKKCIIDKDLCLFWVDHYRKLRKAFDLDSRQKHKGNLSDLEGHKHCSAGMFAIIYALSTLKPKTLTLYGFDNVSRGTFDWSVTRGPDWNQYPDHNWIAESKMLFEVVDKYHYCIEKLNDTVICSLDT